MFWICATVVRASVVVLASKAYYFEYSTLGDAMRHRLPSKTLSSTLRVPNFRDPRPLPGLDHQLPFNLIVPKLFVRDFKMWNLEERQQQSETVSWFSQSLFLFWFSTPIPESTNGCLEQHTVHGVKHSTNFCCAPLSWYTDNITFLELHDLPRCSGFALPTASSSPGLLLRFETWKHHRLRPSSSSLQESSAWPFWSFSSFGEIASRKADRFVVSRISYPWSSLFVDLVDALSFQQPLFQNGLIMGFNALELDTKTRVRV
jgi:hypothetical protein